MIKSLSEKTMEYAIAAHESTCHKYDLKHPYSFHLESVVNKVILFSGYIPQEDLETVKAGAWCHDLLDDTRMTYSQLKTLFGTNVAEIAFALQGEKGRTRKDKANAKYYNEMRQVKYAAFVKVCDRIANAEYSLQNQSFGKYRIYESENDEFCMYLHGSVPDAMLYYLKDFFEQNTI